MFGSFSKHIMEVNNNFSSSVCVYLSLVLLYWHVVLLDCGRLKIKFIYVLTDIFSCCSLIVDGG